MNSRYFVLGMLVLAALAGLVLALYWRDLPPSAGQPPHQPLQERVVEPGAATASG